MAVADRLDDGLGDVLGQGKVRLPEVGAYYALSVAFFDVKDSRAEAKGGLGTHQFHAVGEHCSFVLTVSHLCWLSACYGARLARGTAGFLQNISEAWVDAIDPEQD
jgi:hypothetical protein